MITVLAVAAFIAFVIAGLADSFSLPPTRQLPEPVDVEYWPGFLHELEGGL